MKIMKNKASRSIYSISEYMKNLENLAFSRILPLLDDQKINMGTNFENLQGKDLNLEVKLNAF